MVDDDTGSDTDTGNADSDAGGSSVDDNTGTVLTGDNENLDSGGKPTGEDTPEGGTKPKDGEDTGDDAGGEGGDDDDGSPEAYADFDLPEGMTLNAELLETAVPVFKDLNLTQDQAQKLIDFQAKQIQAGEEAQSAEFNTLKQEWIDAAKADKEYGGDAFDENIAVALSAVEAFGTPELKTVLDTYGIGNHPEMIRFMVKVGRLTQEDNPGTGNAGAGAPKDHAEMLYGT